MIASIKGVLIKGTPEEINKLIKLQDAPIKSSNGRVKDVAKMRELRAEGKTYKQIARACGWSKTTVHKVLNEGGAA